MEVFDLKEPLLAVLIGAPKSGKSFSVRAMIYEMIACGYVQYGTVISPTAALNGEYDFLPKKLIHSAWSEELVNAIVQQQRDNGCPPAFLIIDDCLGEAEFNSKVFKRLVSTYRHLNLRVLVPIQHLASVIPPPVRSCILFGCLFKTTQKIALKSQYDTFGSFCDTFEEFREIIRTLPKHAFFYVRPNDDQSAPGNNTVMKINNLGNFAVALEEKEWQRKEKRQEK